MPLALRVTQEPRAAGMDGCIPWWPLPPWAASDGKGQNGLSTVRSQKMKALTAERCWENPTRCLALLVREGQPQPQGSAGKSHLFRLAQQVQQSPPGLPEPPSEKPKNSGGGKHHASLRPDSFCHQKARPLPLVIPDLAAFELRPLWQ